MPYEHDVFLSYRRHAEWPKWVQRIFLPLFNHWLGEELPGVRIFIDYDIETGELWPQRLPDIAAAVNAAPPCNDEWMNLAIDELVRQFAAPEAIQTVPPKLG